MADNGRLPALRDEVGVLLGSGFAGKEKEGFGSGRSLRGCDGVKEVLSSGEPTASWSSIVKIGGPSSGDSKPYAAGIVRSSSRAAAMVRFAGQLGDYLNHGNRSWLRFDLDSSGSSNK